MTKHAALAGIRTTAIPFQEQPLPASNRLSLTSVDQRAAFLADLMDLVVFLLNERSNYHSPFPGEAFIQTVRNCPPDDAGYTE